MSYFKGSGIRDEDCLPAGAGGMPARGGVYEVMRKVNSLLSFFDNQSGKNKVGKRKAESGTQLMARQAGNLESGTRNTGTLYSAFGVRYSVFAKLTFYHFPSSCSSSNPENPDADNLRPLALLRYWVISKERP